MSGSTVGSFLGAGIGFLVGGPAGARWGWMIGGMVGGIVDPQKNYGPRLSDAQRQTAQEGVPIPFGYGTFPCRGNVIWTDVLVEHEQEEGGKGGPKTVTYTYTRSFAIGFCEGPVTGFQQVRINGKLVYDVSPDSTIQGGNAKFLQYATIYTGAETDTVDPTIEAVEGVGNVPPMRGLAKIIFTDYDCTDTHGGIPDVEVVVQMCGTVTNTTAYSYLMGLGPDFYYKFTENPCIDYTGNRTSLVPSGDFSIGDGIEMNALGAGANASTGALTGGTNCTVLVRVRVDDLVGGTIMKNALTHVTNAILGYHRFSIYLADAGTDMTPTVAIGNEAGGATAVSAPTPLGIGQTAVLGLRLTGTTLECVVDGIVVATGTGSAPGTGSANLLTGGDSVNWLNGNVGHAIGFNRALTDAELYMASVAIDAGDGLLVVPDAPNTYVNEAGEVITIGGTVIASCTVTLATIVTDLCTRAGIDPASELDVSELTDIVTGFACATESGADAYIEALRPGYYFDRAEWDKKLRFPKRGKASVASLTADDLVRLDEDRPCVQQTQIQEAELLRKVNVITLDPATEYRPGKQTWERRAGTIQAKGESTVEIPVVCTATVAAQMAEKRGKIAWSETDKFRFGLPPKWSKLTPTDVVTLTDKRNVAHRVRLQDVAEVAGLITVEEAVKDRQSVYTTAVAAGTTNSNGGGIAPPGLIGPTVLAVLNLPQMRTQDGPGFYVGMAGITSGWSGAQLLMSVDGGVSYTTVLTVTRPTKIGHITSAITSTSATIPVRVYGGSLASATAAQVAVGANMSALLSGAVAELFDYQVATAVSAGAYNLTIPNRGLKGTTAAAHADNDKFVDIATSYFLPVSLDHSGKTLYFKAVGLGLSADSISPITVVYTPSGTIVDGGEVVGPLGLRDRAAAAIFDRAGQVINTRT